MVQRDSLGRFVHGHDNNEHIFKPLEEHPLYRPIGSEYIDDRGSIRVKVAERKWRKKHLLVWEKYHEPLKQKESILFLDGNKQNCDISNLEKVSYSENFRMNYRKLVTANPELTLANLNKLRLEDAIKQKRA